MLQHGSILLRRSKAAPELASLGDASGKRFDAEQLAERWLVRLAGRMAVTWRPEGFPPRRSPGRPNWPRPATPRPRLDRAAGAKVALTSSRVSATLNLGGWGGDRSRVLASRPPPWGKLVQVKLFVLTASTPDERSWRRSPSFSSASPRTATCSRKANWSPRGIAGDLGGRRPCVGPRPRLANRHLG